MPAGRIQLLRESAGRVSWGPSIGYYRFGRFDNPLPGDHYNASALTIGVAARVGARGDAPSPYLSFALDYVGYREGDNSVSGSSFGGGPYIGGGILFGRPRSSRFFVEAGLHPFANTGESTHSSGIYGTVLIGMEIR